MKSIDFLLKKLWLSLGNGSGKSWNLFPILLMLFTIGVGQAWGDPTLLFQETFGTNNSGSAREWSMDYKDQSGVSTVYSGASYTISGAKQSNSSTNAKINNSTNNTEATFIVGPLNVSSYESLSVQFDWQAGTTANKTYYAKLYYATSSSGDYTEISKTSGTNSTSMTTQTFSSISSSAQVSTLYLKVAWKAENVATLIDNFQLYGTEVTKTVSSIALKTSATKTAYVAGEDFAPAGLVITATYDDESTEDIDYDTHSGDFSFSPSTGLTAGTTSTTVTYATKTCSQSINVYSVTLQVQDEDGNSVGVGGPGSPTRTGASISPAADAANYGWKNWVISGASLGSAVSAKSNTITNPTGAVTITAVYYIPRTVTWMVDGEEYTPSVSGGTDGTAAVKYNTAWNTLTLPTDPDPACGDRFMGWTTVNIGGNGLDDDSTLDLMTSANQSGKTGAGHNITKKEITFHAVFADYAE